LRVGGPTGGTPQEFALIVMRSARALIAESFAYAADFSIHLKHIRRTIFALTRAIFRQIALVFGASTFCTRALRPAGLQITTLAGGTACITMQHASSHVATGIVAVLLQAAIALFARFDESVATYGTVKELLRFVPQAIIHTVLEGYGQMF